MCIDASKDYQKYIGFLLSSINIAFFEELATSIMSLPSCRSPPQTLPPVLPVSHHWEEHSGHQAQADVYLSASLDVFLNHTPYVQHCQDMTILTMEELARGAFLSCSCVA